ncbi:MAG: type IV toxin-antitoxin system AbiEi family antitoxin domain-containing protein [Oscillospiraceae bacterium]|jgi:predicted transcriptional regulator of viral defense system|nr:type IV toxin-antitoxin system AbiEi family antitoxin domain-containing protein [Oscillospiraceae bacterium]
MSAERKVRSLLNEKNGLIRTADAVNAGISRATISQLAKDGKIERFAHGQYIQSNDLPDELYLLQQRSKKIVFSHETALFLHGMAERMPIQHALTIPSDSKLSQSLSSGVKIYYVKPELHNMGICSVPSKMGNGVMAYNAERTICDILRSRNRVDGQTVTAAMKNYAARKGQDWGLLNKYAEIFHITKLLRQYLEVLS